MKGRKRKSLSCRWARAALPRGSRGSSMLAVRDLVMLQGRPLTSHVSGSKEILALTVSALLWNAECLNKQVIKATLINKGFREFSPNTRHQTLSEICPSPDKPAPLTGSFIRSAFLLGFVTLRQDWVPVPIDKSELNEWVGSLRGVFPAREGEGEAWKGLGTPNSKLAPSLM